MEQSTAYIPDALEMKRLHPMTILQRGIVSIPGFVLLLLPLLRSPAGETWISLFFVIMYAFVAVPLMIAHYVRFRYRITPSEIVIHSGTLTRRHRNIPIERVHNIEIEQPLLARLTGTAKVKIETAGSTSTEGVLELVSMAEAQHIRQLVRTFQGRAAPAAPSILSTEAPPETKYVSAEAATSPEPVYRMTLGRVFLSGAFRFSLLYIALIFSGLEYLSLDPEEIVYNIERGPFRRFADFAFESPWITGFIAVITAALLSWLTGIVVNLNRFYGFRLSAEDGKLHKKSGLLTVSEGTIPFRRVQAIIFRSNPLMRRFDWWRLELQTMGLDVRQHGHQVAAPFAHRDESLDIANRVRQFDLPAGFQRVSPLHIRRMFFRYTLLLLCIAIPGAFIWRTILWSLAAIPFLLFYALLHFRNHGYWLDDQHLYVRRGVLRHYVWVIPFEKFQVFYASASLFQRRLRLKSIYIDTAGGGALAGPEIQDLPAAEADRLFEQLYLAFQRNRATAASTPARATGTPELPHTSPP
jgi:putative membrane protein